MPELREKIWEEGKKRGKDSTLDKFLVKKEKKKKEESEDVDDKNDKIGIGVYESGQKKKEKMT